MKTLQKLKETSSSNEKLQILEEELNEVNEFLIRKALNDEVFGLSTKTLMKVFNIKDLKGYEDISDWIEKEYKYIFQPVSILKPSLENFFKVCKTRTGNNLVDYLKLHTKEFTKEELIWVCRALLKDLKIGMSVTQINKVFKKLNKTLIEVFQVQLCAPLKVPELDKLNNFPYYCETKYDGTRTIAFIERSKNKFNKSVGLLSFGVEQKEIKITLKSRQGKDTTSQFPEIVKALEEFVQINNLTDVVLDGEIISKDFNSLQKRLGRLKSNIESDDLLKFIVFDIIKYEGEDLKPNEFIVRKQYLKNQNYTNKIQLSNSKVCMNKFEIESFYNDNCNNMEEGIIVKERTGTYAIEKKDERKGMWKIKPVETMDLKIIDFENGTGRHSNTIGSLKLTNKENTIQCDCGSGLSDYERDRLLLLHKEGRLLNRIVEVKYWEIMKPDEKGIRSLRFPIYVCLREDKFESD